MTLRHATPVINGAVLEDFHVEQIMVDPEESRESRLELRYTAPQLGESVFIVQVYCSGDHCSWLRYWIENIHPEEISSFGLRFGQIENLRSYLVNGYTSWDGTFYADVEGLKAIGPDAQRPEHGFAMTQLLPQYGKGGVVLGFDRHERFQQEFHFDTRVTPPALTILTDWDLRRPDPEQPRTCASERLLLIEEEGVEEGLKSGPVRWLLVPLFRRELLNRPSPVGVPGITSTLTFLMKLFSITSMRPGMSPGANSCPCGFSRLTMGLHQRWGIG